MSRQVPHAEDTATGTPTAGLVPISAGPGLAPRGELLVVVVADSQ
jgi:hypothetical protein